MWIIYNTTVGSYEKSDIERTTYFSQIIENIDNEPEDFISRVCKDFVIKLTN